MTMLYNEGIDYIHNTSIQNKINVSVSNVTREVCGGQMTSSDVAILIFYSLIVVVAVGGNVVVCHIVLANRGMRTVTNFFLLNLAFSDITKALICIPFSFVANLLQYWPFGSVMCPFVFYMQAVSVFLSAFTLVAMSLDRYFAIIYPLRQKMTHNNAIFIIIVIWFFAIAVPLPTLVTSKLVTNESRSCDEATQCACYCQEVMDAAVKYIYSMAIMLLQYFIPLGVLSFTYGRIGFVIWIKKTPGEAERTRDERIASSKRKMVKMMIVVVLVYAVCWLPLHAVTIASDEDPGMFDLEYFPIIWTSSHWLAMSHACYNPMVYFWMNKRFRLGFKRVFHLCLFCKPKRSRHNGGISNRRPDILMTVRSSEYCS